MSIKYIEVIKQDYVDILSFYFQENITEIGLMKCTL